jgi:capsid protein
MTIPEQTPFEKKIESTIAKISPKWALERHRARVQFSFEAAQSTRLRSRSNTLAGPESIRTQMDRIEVMKQVRDLEQNFPLFRSIISKIALYTAGRLRYQAQTGDAQINKQTEAWLNKKFKKKNCDAAERFSFRQMAALALQSQLRDGDYGWQLEDHGTNGVPLIKIKGIESDRIGGGYVSSCEPGYVQGVTFDQQTGKIISYRVFNRDTNDSYTNPQEIPADKLKLFVDPWRVDQYRGVSPLAPSVNTGRDLKEVLEATLVGVKFENYHAGFITNERGGLMDTDPNTIISSNQNGEAGTALTEEKLQPGQIKYIPSGSAVNFVKSERPSGQWQSYVTMLVRHIALPLNLPFGFVYDLAGLGGPSARMDAQQAHRVIQGWQQNLIECGLDDTKDAFILEGIARGEIDYIETWNRGIWQFPPAITIDVGRDSAAGITEIRSGLRTKSDWYAEDGKDAEEQSSIIEQEAEATIERAKALAERTGVPINIALDLMEARNPNPTGSFGVVDPSAKDNKTALIQDIGIGGTQALADMIAQVGAGAITPDTARAILVSVFGMTGEQANAIFPPGAQAQVAPQPQEAPPAFSAKLQRLTDNSARNWLRNLADKTELSK